MDVCQLLGSHDVGTRIFLNQIIVYLMLENSFAHQFCSPQIAPTPWVLCCPLACPSLLQGDYGNGSHGYPQITVFPKYCDLYLVG